MIIRWLSAYLLLVTYSTDYVVRDLVVMCVRVLLRVVVVQSIIIIDATLPLSG